jgi:hypothetical protein
MNVGFWVITRSEERTNLKQELLPHISKYRRILGQNNLLQTALKIEALCGLTSYTTDGEIIQ